MASNSEGEFNSTLVDLAPKVELMRILECPVCSENFSGKIFLCLSGHSICKDCKEKVLECPSCKSKWSEARNFILEEIIQSSVHACSFKGDSCKVVGNGEFIQKHIRGCRFRPTKCPYLAFTSVKTPEIKVFCETTTLKLSSILQHLVSAHEVDVVESETIHLTTSLLANPEEIKGLCIFCSGMLTFDTKWFSFTFLSSKGKGRFFCIVLLLGTRDEEGCYRAKITLQPGKKLMRAWDVPVHSTFDRDIRSILDEDIHLPSLTWKEVLKIVNTESNENIRVELECSISKFEES